MPYFVSDSAAGCDGFATVKEDGEVIGCHKTKQDAIDQMVAVSIAEKIEPGGDYAERVSPNLPEAYRPAASPDVPANRNCGNCGFYKNFYCKRWDALVSPAYYCAAWEPVEGLPNDNPGQEVQTGDVSDYGSNMGLNYFDRQVDLDVPVYIRNAARKGLDYYGKGLGGDGLVPRTIREAREMAQGRVSEDKVVRAAAWGARHMGDLDAVQNSNPNNEQFPGAGAVAFYLWGMDPTNPQPALRWFERKSEQIKAERADAPAPKKDQITGSEKNPAGSAAGPAGGDTIELTEAIETGLKNKVAEHNDKLDGADPAWKRATVGMLRSVYRRGAGAFSVSHRPGMTRNQWAMARVNSFLYLLRNGRPENAAYVTDNDLLPKDHPKSSRSVVGRMISIDGMEEKVETRRITAEGLELRQSETGDGMAFSGYAAVFNTDSEPLPFTERIMYGAFKKSLKSKNNIRMYLNHDSSMLLATSRAKTLRLEEDNHGLRVEADLPDTTIGRDLRTLIQRGDVDSMSFGFSVPPKGDSWSDDGMTRELREVRLYEVSVVTGFPAYQATTASVRSLDLLAQRTALDVDKIAEAITVLESGSELNDDQAGLLTEVVAKLRKQPEHVATKLSVLQKQLDLAKDIV